MEMVRGACGGEEQKQRRASAVLRAVVNKRREKTVTRHVSIPGPGVAPPSNKHPFLQGEGATHPLKGAGVHAGVH